MDSARDRDREKGKRTAAVREAVVFLLLLLAGFYVNRHIHIHGLYMDDLYMWSCYGEQSYFAFAFPIGTSTRFRPVYWTLTYLEMMLVRNHPSLFVPVNIILNVGCAYFIYRCSRKLSGGLTLIPFLSALLYLFSHFSYYQIGQALGLLETMSLFLALYILFLLYDYQRDGAVWRFLLANLVYFLLVFSHERYLALFPLFPLVLFSGKRREGRVRLLFLSILNLILILLLRGLAIGSVLPAGTGGTEVSDTFSLGQALRFSLSQVAYLFGVNAGPEYLSGIPFSEAAPWLRRLVFLSWLPLFLLLFSALLWAIPGGRGRKASFLGGNLLFLSFIALCIGCSSVTIRVEMRWIYVSYAAALLYLSWIAGEGLRARRAAGAEEEAGGSFGGEGGQEAEEGADFSSGHDAGSEGSEPTGILSEAEGKGAAAKDRKGGRRICLSLLFFAYFLCISPVERYYRSYFPKIYFWENQDRMNSLADQTIGRYGREGVFGKQVYILGNSYHMTDFYARTFFKVYDRERTAGGTRIHFLRDLSELPDGAGRENSLILEEVPEERGYRDITEQSFGGGEDA